MHPDTGLKYAPRHIVHPPSQPESIYCHPSTQTYKAYCAIHAWLSYAAGLFSGYVVYFDIVDQHKCLLIGLLQQCHWHITHCCNTEAQVKGLVIDPHTPLIFPLKLVNKLTIDRDFEVCAVPLKKKHFPIIHCPCTQIQLGAIPPVPFSSSLANLDCAR